LFVPFVAVPVRVVAAGFCALAEVTARRLNRTQRTDRRYHLGSLLLNVITLLADRKSIYSTVVLG